MAKHTIKEAARLVGISRTTLYQKMKDGEISWEPGPGGSRQIDTAELIRVFGPLRSSDADSPPDVQTGRTEHDRTDHSDKEIRALTQHIETLRQSLAAAEADKADLRARLDAAEAERRQILRLLEHHEQREHASERSVPWWRRWFGKR